MGSKCLLCQKPLRGRESNDYNLCREDFARLSPLDQDRVKNVWDNKFFIFAIKTLFGVILAAIPAYVANAFGNIYVSVPLDIVVCAIVIFLTARMWLFFNRLTAREMTILQPYLAALGRGESRTVTWDADRQEFPEP